MNRAFRYVVLSLLTISLLLCLVGCDERRSSASSDIEAILSDISDAAENGMSEKNSKSGAFGSVSAPAKPEEPDSGSEAEADPGTQADQPDNTEEKPETVSHTVEVYDVFRETILYDGDIHTFMIPAVRIDGMEVPSVNDIIYNDLYTNTYVPFVKDSMEAYDCLDISSLTYHWSSGNGILSIVTYYRDFFSDGGQTHIYNVKIDEMRPATDDEVLAAFGIGAGSYTGLAQSALGSYFWDSNAENMSFLMSDPAIFSDIILCYYKTVSVKNAGASVPFAGEEGLSLLGTIYIPAGAGYFQREIKLDYPVNASHQEWFSAPSAADLEGSWHLVSGETEGYRYTAEEEDIHAYLIFSDYGFAKYDYYLHGALMESYDWIDILFLRESLYDGCPNEIWDAKFNLEDSGKEYYFTLMPDGTLHMMRFTYLAGEEYPVVAALYFAKD